MRIGRGESGVYGGLPVCNRVGGERDGKSIRTIIHSERSSETFGVNPQAVYRLINGKQLIALRLGLIKIRGSDLERFIEQYPAYEPEEGGDQSGEA